MSLAGVAHQSTQNTTATQTQQSPPSNLHEVITLHMIFNVYYTIQFQLSEVIPMLC